jgi:WD40 repeat protein
MLVWRLDHDGRFAFGLGDAMRVLSIYDLHHESEPRRFGFPSGSGISAWELSSDGRHLALGDFEGRVFLLDTRTFDLRQLPVLRGREITWLAFSEDDAWLALANFDGLAQLIDVTTGDSLAGGEMRAKIGLQRVGVSRAQRLLAGAGTGGEVALWRIPKEGPRTRPAKRIGLGPAAHGSDGRYATAWSLDTGVLAEAGLNGQIRIWRLPTSPTIPSTPPRQLADSYHPSSDRLVDVEWNRLRLVSPRGRALTAWLTLRQPPGYAELVDDGQILLVTVGPTLEAYDPVQLTARYPPVELPSSPERVLASADGRYVLLVFGAHTGQGHEEHLRLLDGRTGRWLPGDAVLSGPSPSLAFSPDLERIVAVGPADGVTTVLSTEGLVRIAEYPHDPFEPVIAADFTGDRLLVLTQPPDPRYGRESVIWWDFVADRIDARQDLFGLQPQTVRAAAGMGAVIGGVTQDAVVTADGKKLRWPRIATLEPGAPRVAMSPDGKLYARVYRQEVQLHDAATGALVGPPLVADVNTLDWIFKVEFTPDGKALAARSGLGADLRWPIEREGRIVERLAADIERLLPSVSGDQVLYAPTASERRRLRGNDPGPWPRADARPQIPMASNTKPGLVLPARAEGTPPWLLDLAPVAERDTNWFGNTFWYYVSPRRMPVGVQRIAGVDFDIRGMLQLGADAEGSGVGEGARFACLEVPEIPIAAVYLLAQAFAPSPVPTGEPLARLTLHYRDGSDTVLLLRAGQELPGFAGSDAAAPEAFATDFGLNQIAGIFNTWFVPRLENPHPERVPRCLDLEVTRSEGAVVVFGITAEPLVQPGA